jgi:hypothetical protein
MQPMTLDSYADVVRNVNVLLCTLVFAGLLWRMIGRWTISFPLGRWIVGLLAALEFIVALGTAARAAVGGAFNPAQYLITLHGLIALAVVAYWPRIAALGTYPLTRPETPRNTAH